MSDDLSYRTYVQDQAGMQAYNEYQTRYANQIRESDKVLIEMIRQIAKAAEPLRLVDIGCSTGNLLLHLKYAVPTLSLTGIDIVANTIEACLKNADLRGIKFDVKDMLRLDESQLEPQDIAVTNAALMFFSETEFDQAVQNIGAITRTGGHFLAFDFFHPFEQAIEITEKSAAHPMGLKFYFRSYKTVKDSLERAGFTNITFTPFNMPIDLPKPPYHDITSHTIETKDDFRMSFRGSLFQPWCHLQAQKR
jgi:SAM-dependent methyltransferase